uniref:Dedicator of cytokinesis protein 9 n=1 Tax=Steinernema glaseri TaxID=37863 RepID=A0A1I7XZF1_9BILA
MRSSTFRSGASIDDRRSLISGSSGASTLIESASVRSSQTLVSAVSQKRKFTASVGRPGQARETREAVRNVMSNVNPARKSPIAPPLEYEKFITDKSAQLENDPQRELLLFPRDDLTEVVVEDDSSIPPSQSGIKAEDASWLLTRECLQHYCNPSRTIRFNYAKFSGDYDYRPSMSNTDFSPILFESDLVEDEKAADINQNQLRDETLKEGYLMILPNDVGILDNLKSVKKRYCTVRKDVDSNLILDIQKQAGPNVQTNSLVIQSATLKTTKKGKTVVEVTFSSGDRKNALLASEAENDIIQWCSEMNRFLLGVEREDTPGDIESLKSATVADSACGETESVASDDSLGIPGSVWRGRNAAAKALQPPIVKRKNLFNLYWDLDPLSPVPGGESSFLSAQHDSPVKIRNSSPVVRTTSKIYFTVELEKLNITLQNEQVEPLFLRMYLFDASEGIRLCEEFHQAIPCDGNVDKTKMMCSVDNPHSNLFLISRVERILADVSPDIYMKSSVDVKTAAKYHKSMEAAALKLKKYRTALAWSVRHIFKAPTDTIKEAQSCPLYKADGKLTDTDLQKFLGDLPKAEKSGKLSTLPNASITLKVKFHPRVDDSAKRISSTSESCQDPANFEMQSFTSAEPAPYKSFVNQLYVYPLGLNFGSQKSFSKARNIACTVTYVPSKKRNGSNKVILKQGQACTEAVTSVTYHDQNPNFSDEVKMDLPIALDSTDHLLFSFTHISVNTALGPKTQNEAFEAPVGHAWLPLVKNDRLVMENDTQEFSLSVAVALPQDYINYQSFGLGKGHTGPDIKWVENGRGLFHVRLRLVSSIFTSDLRLQAFFQSCQKFEKVGTIGDSAEKAQALLDIEIARLVPFLHVSLNRLFTLLPMCTTDELSLSTLSALIGIVDKATASNRKDLLNEFIAKHFSTRHHSANQDESVHSALCKYIPMLMRNIHGDTDALAVLYKQLWFLLDVVSKSIAETVLDKGLYKNARKDRFPAELLFRIEVLTESVVSGIISKHKTFPSQCRSANTAVANFLRCMLSFIDRGLVFNLIHYAVDKFDANESRTLRDYKLDLLRVISGHEHYLALSLPILCDKRNIVMRKESCSSASEHSNSSSTNFLSKFFAQVFSSSAVINELNDVDQYAKYKDHFWLSDQYCSTHFPTGLLLQELNASLREPRDYRRKAIALIRNLLAKHSVDSRFSDTGAQSRIVTLYAPFLQILLKHLEEIKSTTKAVTDAPALSIGLRSPLLDDKKSATLASNGSSSKVVDSMALNEKLDKEEVRDLLLCNLYILHHIPKKVLATIWSQHLASDASSVTWIIDLLDVSLEMFRYRGKAYHTAHTAKRIRGTARSIVILPPSSSAVHQEVPTVPDEANNTDLNSVLLEAHLTQEIALIVLETSRILANHIAAKTKHLDSDTVEAAFSALLRLQLSLLDESWPEAVRLHVLAALAVFINVFRSRFFQFGPLDYVSLLIENLLIQLNSRIESVQNAAAALFQLILRSGYDTVHSTLVSRVECNTLLEHLGRPGAQAGVALATLLGNKKPLANSPRFLKGLSRLESLVANYSNRHSDNLFEQACQELIKQLRGVLKATGALAAAANDPIRLADLHIQLADSYRGSAALRCAWFDTLAEAHIADRWYSEAAVCQAHSLAIIGKELETKGLLKPDWSLLSHINSSIIDGERVFDEKASSTQQAGYTLDNFTAKAEQLVQTLVLSERFEAIGPLCRMAIPVYEAKMDYKALVSMYAELQQAYCRAGEVKTYGKRHLGAYFRVVFYGRLHFKEDDNSEWIYREHGCTSLAEACERLAELVKNSLGHDHVEVVGETDFNVNEVKPSVAYLQVTHVKPWLEEEQENVMNYAAHTNIKKFFYESPTIEEAAEESAPIVAKQALKRIYLTTERSFPNTNRRQRICTKEEKYLNPLEFACDQLQSKTAEIRRILAAAHQSNGNEVVVDQSSAKRVDLKRLQLMLQGAVQPTVNAGPLAFAEAFTSSPQKDRYGEEGLKKLTKSFQEMAISCSDALKINEIAIGPDQAEYHAMLKNAFAAMLERLQQFFGNEIVDEIRESLGMTQNDSNENSKDVLRNQTSLHIFDSIGGVTS